MKRIDEIICVIFLGLLTLGCSNDDDGCSPLTYEIKNLENVYFCVDTQNGVVLIYLKNIS